MASFVLITNIPTPYRNPWFDAVAQAAAPDEFVVLYLGPAHPRRRAWSVPPGAHRSEVLSDRVLEGRWGALHPVVGIGRALDRLNPSAVVVGGWDQLAFWEAKAYCHRRRIPFIPSIESHATSGERRGGFSNALREAFLRGAAGVVCVSDETVSYVRALGYGGPVRVVPNAAAMPTVAPTAPPRSDSLRLLFIGELSERKNPLGAVAMAGELAREGAAVELVLAGAGPLQHAIETRAGSSPARIRLAGFVTQEGLEARWAEATCLVLPSLADPAPLVLSEAAIRGVPFAASDRCGSASTLLRLGAGGAIFTLQSPISEQVEAVRAAASVPRRCSLAVTPITAADGLLHSMREWAR